MEFCYLISGIDPTAEVGTVGVILTTTYTDVIAAMNELGGDGWTMVNTVSVVDPDPETDRVVFLHYFTRPTA